MSWIVVALAAPIVVAGALALFTALIAGLVEGAVPATGKTMSIDGATIRYLDEGSGPTIVLIHGLAGNMRHFTYRLKDLLIADHRVIMFDRPGCGYSKLARGASPRLGPQAATIAGFIQTLDVDRPLILGHSLGGALALALALDHPAVVGGLALVSPLSHMQERPPSVFSLLATPSALRRRVTAWLLATPGSLFGGKAVLAQIFGPDRPPHDFGKNAGGFLTMRPESFIAASAELAAVPDALPTMEMRYSSITCPVGILYGDKDAVLDYRTNGEALVQKIPGATLELITNGGHMAPIVMPERVAQFVRSIEQRIEG